MAIYVKNGRLFQIREQIAAEYDLLDDFKTYVERLAKEAGDEIEKNTKQALTAIEDDKQMSQFLLFALNQALGQSGEETIRYRSMVYEYSKPTDKVSADLPVGADVRKGSLDFFGVNAKASGSREVQVVQPGTEGEGTTSTTVADGSTTPTTVAP